MDTGTLYEQAITVKDRAQAWRRITLTLDTPTAGAGERVIRLWSNLPDAVTAEQRRPTVGAGGSRGCSSGWRACSTTRSVASGIRGRRYWALRQRFSLTTRNASTQLVRCVEQAHTPTEVLPVTVLLFHRSGDPQKLRRSGDRAGVSVSA